MAIIDVGSRRRAPATMIGDEEGAHDDDREMLKQLEIKNNMIFVE